MIKKVNSIISASWIFTADKNNTLLEDHSIVILEDEILDILPTKNVFDGYEANEVFALSEHIIMPGFINNHTNAAMSLLKGFANDVPLKSWLEDYINKQLFKKLLKKVGAIKGTYPNTVIPTAYIDFLQDPKTFDIITKALPIKSIKKSYGKLFEIERIGREVTAEGNPIFRIKKIDKTKFFKYFVDGKKSTILERQKQLFREILTPVTKQIVADIATVENLSSLKEIQSLAPSQSVDVVNSIAIEAQLNELESQIDRYKGEKTGFDIIQFSKSLSKEDKAAISKKLGYKSDGVIAMAQLAAQIISQTISPTRRKYNKSLKSIEEKLGHELWEKVWKNTLKDYTNILDSCKAKQE